MIDKTSARRIEQWGTVPGSGDSFTAPEVAGIKIAGLLGDRDVITSRVVAVDGRFVQTRSGSVYELGEAHADFLVAVAEMGRTFDPEQPITVRS